MSGTSRLTDGAALAVELSDSAALDPTLVGAKAANLAQAARAGLPVLTGFTLTTTATGDPSAPHWPPNATVEPALRQLWQQLHGDEHGLVVRSSSTVEDIGASSMAGQFKSVSGVVGWARFVAAVGTAIVYFVGGRMVIDGTITIGTLAALTLQVYDVPLVNP